ncbi:hypothetical protein [Salimicrobium album]|uniref:Uncharacterized protein n=1 Tax=Salimicrobium album TaxID=50717 RepID=A0A1H3DEX7_9BACI|nr:hypothetical protein [Salimicrobium album]SDX64890.1 hypothetical protein SAMN04488081_0938 [Salimicrobium album]
MIVTQTYKCVSCDRSKEYSFRNVPVPQTVMCEGVDGDCRGVMTKADDAESHETVIVSSSDYKKLLKREEEWAKEVHDVQSRLDSAMRIYLDAAEERKKIRGIHKK